MILLLVAALLFAQQIQGRSLSNQESRETKGQILFQEKEDEQEPKGELVVSYTSGSEDILNREVYKETDKIPITKLPVADTTPVPTLIPPQEELPASGAYVSSFSPICYPKLENIIGTKYLMEDLQQLTYLKDNFYIVNSTTKMTETEFDVNYFLEADLSLEQTDAPQILIYHTHGSEGFSDSRAGESEDTVIGVGELLAEILREKYGYTVLHDTSVFDKKNGKDNRNYAYNDALPYIEKILEENPSIEVVIDLHRDAGEKRVVTIDEKPVAKIMLFNGLCRNTKGKLTYLPNENLADNLAFSFQMKLVGDEMYPGLMNRIFLKDYRYNMHLAERYLLIELGTEQNTVEEARNAMEPLADVLAQVLGG